MLALAVVSACSDAGVADPIPFDSDSGDSTLPDVGEVADDLIVVRTDAPIAELDPMVLGTNVPAWLLPEMLADETFRTMAVASGTSMLRMPGGSWSNDYHWLDCELDREPECGATWASRPSDFLALLDSTGLDGMWTAAFNGTAQEAAALVAFFNGEASDERTIGVDRNGRDWQTVGSWARLRAERGFPDPVPIQYWEVGNEIYGAVPAAGSACAEWGWENVWTCDGSEYVDGDDDHDGFLDFREAMVAVDSTIRVGGVGVGDLGAWDDWDARVMSGAGDALDFYVVHHYGSDGNVAADDVLDLPGRNWPNITAEVREGFEAYGLDSDTPIAVTEHNLVSFIDGDDEVLMPTALNAFYLADTIGQFALNGVTIANQWNLMNGRAANGSDYGLIDGEVMARTPAYYALALWSRFGERLVDVAVGDGDGFSDLRVYGGIAADGSPSLLVLNSGEQSVSASVEATSEVPLASISIDVVAVDSLDSTTATWNGAEDPAIDLATPVPKVTGAPDGGFRHEFAPFSMTLLRWGE